MFKRRDTKPENEFVELPTGIFTASGIWFHTTEADIREFAGGVLDTISLSRLLDQAIIWTRSPDGVAAAVFLAVLFQAGPVIALIAGVLTHYLWYVFLPVLVSVAATPLMRLLSSVIFQGLLYIVVLSYLGNMGFGLWAVVGLVWFLLLRFGLVARSVQAVASRIGEAGLPKADAVLKTLIVRHAIAGMITIPATESFEDRIREIWQRGKRKG